MKKLSKLTALLLALLMAFAAPMAAVAETITTEKQYEEQVSAILAQLYDTLMQTTTYEEVREATKGMTRTEIVNFLDRLLADKVVTDDFAAYDEYLWALYEEYMTYSGHKNPVNFSNAAPLADYGNSAETASVLSVQERGDTTTTDSGVSLTKTATMNNDGTSGTIRLEAFSTGSYTETTTSTAVDVILVLDLSRSMYTGNKTNDGDYLNKYSYPPITTEPVEGTKYYVQYNSMYVPVEFCDDCEAWTYGCYHVGYDSYNSTYYKEEINGVQVVYPTNEFCTQTTIASNVERIDALRDAVIKFVSQIKAESTSIDNRVAFVKFNSENAAKVYIGASTYETSASTNSLISMKNKAETAEAIVGATINYSDDRQERNLWSMNQGTYVDSGTQMAYDIFKWEKENNAADYANRKRIVIVFTDGYAQSNTVTTN